MRDNFDDHLLNYQDGIVDWSIIPVQVPLTRGYELCLLQRNFSLTPPQNFPKLLFADHLARGNTMYIDCGIKGSFAIDFRCLAFLWQRCQEASIWYFNSWSLHHKIRSNFLHSLPMTQVLLDWPERAQPPP